MAFNVNTRGTRKVPYFGIILPAVPKKIRYLACDKDGELIGYTHRPKPPDAASGNRFEYTKGETLIIMLKCPYAGDWRDSLKKI